MKEIWKDIKDYEGLYQVSNLGRVKSLKKNKILKGLIGEYIHVVCKGKCKSVYGYKWEYTFI